MGKSGKRRGGVGTHLNVVADGKIAGDTVKVGHDRIEGEQGDQGHNQSGQDGQIGDTSPIPPPPGGPPLPSFVQFWVMQDVISVGRRVLVLCGVISVGEESALACREFLIDGAKLGVDGVDACTAGGGDAEAGLTEARRGRGEG